MRPRRGAGRGLGVWLAGPVLSVSVLVVRACGPAERRPLPVGYLAFSGSVRFLPRVGYLVRIGCSENRFPVSGRCGSRRSSRPKKPSLNRPALRWAASLCSRFRPARRLDRDRRQAARGAAQTDGDHHAPYPSHRRHLRTRPCVLTDRPRHLRDASLWLPPLPGRAGPAPATGGANGPVGADRDVFRDVRNARRHAAGA